MLGYRTSYNMPSVAVLGAGVVGLSTALRISQLIPDAQLTVLAEGFTSKTTSYGVAGIFRPTLSKTPGVPLDLLKSAALILIFISNLREIIILL